MLTVPLAFLASPTLKSISFHDTKAKIHTRTFRFLVHEMKIVEDKTIQHNLKWEARVLSVFGLSE